MLRRANPEPGTPTPMGGPNTPVVDVIHSLGDPAEAQPIGGIPHAGGRRVAEVPGAPDKLMSSGDIEAQHPQIAQAYPSMTEPGGPQVGQQPMAPPVGGGKVGGKAAAWALRQIQEVGTREARLRLLAVARSHGAVSDKDAARVHSLLTRKVADSNYLQKADEALTKVLNEKAEEFQQTIAPLQQALITIQQAEQMSNPLNVSPPAGTVNVLPGQQGAGGAAMGQTGGGVGMGVQPAAAGLAGQPATQAMQQTARKRGGRGKGQRG
jgi:hypothetical protein